MSSDTFTANSTIEAVLNDNWDAEACPIAWPGVNFEPPDGPWMRLVVQWGDGFEESMGPTNLNRLVGLIVLSLFDKPGSGEGGINGLADTARDLFNRQILDSVVRCGAASPPKPIDGDAKWQQLNVTIPIEIEETV